MSKDDDTIRVAKNVSRHTQDDQAKQAIASVTAAFASGHRTLDSAADELTVLLLPEATVIQAKEPNRQSSISDIDLREALTVMVPSGLLVPEQVDDLVTCIAERLPQALPPQSASQHDSSEHRNTKTKVGDVINARFVILDAIGEGGMGTVFRAKDLRKEEALDRNPYVALKILSPQFAQDPNMMIALQRESKKAQSLAHPNVITVYDFDRDGDIVYLTMEVLEGQTLSELIRAHPRGLPTAQALDIIRGMSLGLAYAHKKDIVHSDFKPGNVFYTNNSETKILDFGIARAVPRRGEVVESDVTSFDVASLGALTPSYASPEMLAGGTPEQHDDVYALALVAFELLTGRHPFDRKPADQAQSKGLTIPSSKRLTRRQAKVLAQGLRFDGAQRPADAAAFLRQMDGMPTIRKVSIAAIAGFALTSAYLAYDGTTKVLDTLPDQEFSELALSAQNQFREHFDDGAIAEEFNDMNFALDQYTKAYLLHPRNREAVAALDRIMERIGVVMTNTDNPKDVQAMRENLIRIGEIDEFLAQRASRTDALK